MSAASRARCSSIRPISPASAMQANRLGVDLDVPDVRWREIRDRIFGRIDPDGCQRTGLSRAKRQCHLFIEERARFVGLQELDVGAAETITADQFVIAAGSRPVIPELSGLDLGATSIPPTP